MKKAITEVFIFIIYTAVAFSLVELYRSHFQKPGVVTKTDTAHVKIIHDNQVVMYLNDTTKIDRLSKEAAMWKRRYLAEKRRADSCLWNCENYRVIERWK